MDSDTSYTKSMFLITMQIYITLGITLTVLFKQDLLLQHPKSQWLTGRNIIAQWHHNPVICVFLCVCWEKRLRGHWSLMIYDPPFNHLSRLASRVSTEGERKWNYVKMILM